MTGLHDELLTPPPKRVTLHSELTTALEDLRSNDLRRRERGMATVEKVRRALGGPPPPLPDLGGLTVT